MTKSCFLFFCLLFCVNLLHAQDYIVNAEDSVSKYTELFSKYLLEEEKQKAIYYGSKLKEICDKEKYDKDSTYCLFTEMLSELYYSQSNIAESLKLLIEIEPIKRHIYGGSSIGYARLLRQLSHRYYALGDYFEAIKLDSKAMDIFRKVVGTNHPDYATSLRILTSCYSGLGNFSEAIRLGTEAMEIYKDLLGTENCDYAISLNDLACCYSNIGYYSEAIRLETKATEIFGRVLGTVHTEYARSLSNLASFNNSIGNYSEAIRLGEEAAKIRRMILGSEHYDYANSLHNLANYNASLGNYSEAIEFATKAAEIRQKVLGAEHPEYVMSLSNLASFNNSIGNYSEAIRQGTEALKICKTTFGTEHPEYVRYITNLAGYYFWLGNYSEAYSLLQKSAGSAQNIVIKNFSELSSIFQESIWTSNFDFFFNSFFPSTVFKHQNKESISELYDKSALFAKGVLLNSSVGMRELILDSGDSVLVSKYDALAANKSIYDKQLEKPIKERFIDIDSLRSVIQRQEMELARDSKAYGDFAKNLRIKCQDVQQRLGNNDLAIEFLDFPLYGTDSTMYVALTLKKEYDNPHMTTLFEKRQLKSVSEDNYYTNTDLYNLIWKPLEEELSGVENIYFSPSGDLHRIGIEYIPMTMTENICDKYNLHRLSSTRQLAYIQDETKGDKSVLYGGLKYDAAVSDTISASPSTRENRGFTFVPRAIVDSLDIRGSYKYLPGTKEEADHIVSYLNTHSIPYKYYYGAAGTEESFKGLDGSKPKTLHIATHGFYMTEQDAERKNFARPLLLEEGRAYHEDKPMTRSGLLLSGCSRALNHENIPDGIEDGILTADEISKLDLRGLDLVVLSACQTALGDITSGEGVFGLQRGFKNAGAKTIIMSLWNVSDFATQHLMTSFYNHYLSGMPKEQSFRMAQKELRELIGPGQDKPDWAAFVMLDGI